MMSYTGGSHKEFFVDRLMRTYTSEAVYLLTTLVNMARARSHDSDSEPSEASKEEDFIKTIVLEIFEVRNRLFFFLCVCGPGCDCSDTLLKLMP